MTALSVRQPWAWLIVHDYKPVENRTWATRYRGPLLIHAGKHIDPEGLRVASRFGIELPLNLECGGIIGQVELIDCVTDFDSIWFSGPFGFVLSNPRPFHSPWPCRGRLGFFEVAMIGATA